MRPRPTFFLDIDGTILSYPEDWEIEVLEQQVLLPGAKDFFKQCDAIGAKIIITTGRKESLRTFTEKQLAQHGIHYEALLLGVGGNRVLVNDYRIDGSSAAFAVNVKRDGGLDLNIEDLV